MDYLDYFNLKEDPFRLTPDTDFFYPSKTHNDVLASLDYAIQQKEGFSLVLGEPGTGKTTLVKIFVARWKDQAEIALIMTPRLSPEELLQAVLDDLNVPPKTLSKNGLIMAFRDFLIDRSLAGKRVMIIVDEAQNLSDAALEELRLLSNLETEKEKLLQIILVGQPELGKRLQADNMRQLNQRITVRAALRPLNAEEISDYIAYRLIKAGKDSLMFDEKIKKTICRCSRGIPRIINLITSRAMMAAYIATSSHIRKAHVLAAVEHAAIHTTKRTTRWSWKGYAVSLILAAVLISLSLFLAETFQSSRNPVAEPTQTVMQSPVTPPPLPTAPVKPQRTATITSDNARLRERPSLEAKIADTVSPEDLLMIVGEWTERSGNKWYQVNTSTGKEGWIAAYIVRVRAD